MSVLGKYFASALWLLKSYKKEVGGLDISDNSKEEITTTLNNCINELQELQSKFRYRRVRKINE